MAGKKQNSRHTSHVSSAAALSTSAATHNANASIVERAVFAPSVLQLSLFASVIQGLNGHQVRVHDIVSCDIQCQHELHGARITSLDWGCLGGLAHEIEYQGSKKKRRLEETNGVKTERGEVVIGLGTSQSEVQLFSPSRAKTIASLRGGHSSSVKDFKFINYGFGGEGWSLGADKKLVQWNLKDQKPLRSIDVPISPPSTLFPFPSAVLIASHDTWLVDLQGDSDISQVSTGTSAVHTIAAPTLPESQSIPHKYLTASQSERQILIYDTEGAHPEILTLNAGGDVEQVALQDNSGAIERDGQTSKPRALAAITRQGELELFTDPFEFPSSTSKGSKGLKSKMKNRTRTSKASVTIRSSGANSVLLALVGACFYGDDLVMAYVERSGHLGFERVLWRSPETKEVVLSGPLVLNKAPLLVGVENTDMVGAKLIGKTQIDESRTKVSYGVADAADAMLVDSTEPIMISSGEDESDFDEDDSASNGTGPEEAAMEDRSDAGPTANSNAAPDRAQGGDLDDAADMEPTFGDLLRSNGTETIDVAAALAKSQLQSMVPYHRDDSRLTGGLTLSNVLSQALRTNDSTLLESCFHEPEPHVIRATIERLDSSLATSLLQKLAEKLHSRPGRAGSLMVWIQWTLVSHGGYLGSQPDTVTRLAALHRVVKERASSLQPLLSLKGKLDMLEAQMNLRKGILNRSGPTGPSQEEEEENVIYVEGQEDVDADDLHQGTDGDESDVDDDAAGLDEASDSESSEDSTSDSAEGFVDDAAADSAVSDASDADEDVDYDDVDSADEASDDGEGPTALRPLPNGVGK